MFDEYAGRTQENRSGRVQAFQVCPQLTIFPKNNDVTVYEAEPRLGGHARTVMAGKNGDQPVDTGFIVFNYATYPYLTRLFDELNVPVIKSEMSFGATIDNGRIEYGLNNLRTLTAQKRNLARPAYYKMIADILRFGKEAPEAAQDDDTTIGELVDQLRLGHWFRHNYLMPMCGAIWSTPVEFVDQFPARSLVQFFATTPCWPAAAPNSINGTRSRAAASNMSVASTPPCAPGAPKSVWPRPVDHIHRDETGVTVHSQGQADLFDEIILATHSDQSLAILGQTATDAEKAALGCDPVSTQHRNRCIATQARCRAGGPAGPAGPIARKLGNVGCHLLDEPPCRTFRTATHCS